MTRLDYASPRRRLPWRWIAAAAVGLTAALLWWFWPADATERLRVAYHSRQGAADWAALGAGVDLPTDVHRTGVDDAVTLAHEPPELSGHVAHHLRLREGTGWPDLSPAARFTADGEAVAYVGPPPIEYRTVEGLSAPVVALVVGPDAVRLVEVDGPPPTTGQWPPPWPRHFWQVAEGSARPSLVEIEVRRPAGSRLTWHAARAVGEPAGFRLPYTLEVLGETMRGELVLPLKAKQPHWSWMLNGDEEWWDAHACHGRLRLGHDAGTIHTVWDAGLMQTHTPSGAAIVRRRATAAEATLPRVVTTPTNQWLPVADVGEFMIERIVFGEPHPDMLIPRVKRLGEDDHLSAGLDFEGSARAHAVSADGLLALLSPVEFGVGQVAVFDLGQRDDQGMYPPPMLRPIGRFNVPGISGWRVPRDSDRCEPVVAWSPVGRRLFVTVGPVLHVVDLDAEDAVRSIPFAGEFAAVVRAVLPAADGESVGLVVEYPEWPGRTDHVTIPIGRLKR